MLFWTLLSLTAAYGLVVHTPKLPDSVYPHVKSTDIEVTHPIHRAQLVLASPMDGCDSRWANADHIVGKVVLVERGVCSFNEKIIHAQVTTSEV